MCFVYRRIVGQEAERRWSAKFGAYEDRLYKALYPENAPPSAAARALDPHNPYLESVKEARAEARNGPKRGGRFPMATIPSILCVSHLVRRRRRSGG